MATRKEREKMEEAERKAEEKAAKKAELAAKRAARDAEKAAKAAAKASAGEGEGSVASKRSEENDDPNAWTADESEALVEGIRAHPLGSHDTEQGRWEAIASGDGLERRRDALECVAHYKSLLAKLRAVKSIKKVGPSKKKPMLAKKREMEEAARAKKAEAEAKRELELRLANGGRLTAEELGFFIRSGPDANRRANSNMDIQIGNIQLYGGRQELLTDATLKLVHGTKYGLVGRNGTGKSTPSSTPSPTAPSPCPSTFTSSTSSRRRLRARNPPFRRSSTPISSATICSRSRRSCWTRIRTRTREST